MCELGEVDFEKLASRARDQDTAGKRRLVVTLGVERWRQKGTQLAKVLNKNPDVVSLNPLLELKVDSTAMPRQSR